MKLLSIPLKVQQISPAAFGRLCVETHALYSDNCGVNQPPSGGCVLKHADTPKPDRWHGPAAFGRLCVETDPHSSFATLAAPAAFGRLCVETIICRSKTNRQKTSRLRAAVC